MRKTHSHLLTACALFSAVLFLSSLLTGQVIPPPGAFQTDLVAGNPKNGLVDAGDVIVWNDTNYLYVRYIVSGDWYLTESHLHVATASADIPQTKKGNPIPGQFDYSEYHNPMINNGFYTYVIPLGDWACDDDLFIAAHGVVQSAAGYVADICALIGSLPATVDFNLYNPYSPTFSAPWTAYFGITVLGDSVLTGLHPGWCIDTDTTIDQGPVYTANVYASDNCPEDPTLFQLPVGLLEHPENLDLVNWIINQDYVGQTAACGGTFTYGDIQRAIWALVDDKQSGDGIGPWSQCRVDEILTAAKANGEGFTPGCDQKIAIILEPIAAPEGVDIPAQLIFLEFPVPCTYEGDETVWGYGLGFPGKDWGMYFSYTIQCPTGD